MALSEPRANSYKKARHAWIIIARVSCKMEKLRRAIRHVQKILMSWYPYNEKGRASHAITASTNYRMPYLTLNFLPLSVRMCQVNVLFPIIGKATMQSGVIIVPSALLESTVLAVFDDSRIGSLDGGGE